MDIFTEILIGIGLAMDAAAVSMAGGTGRKGNDGLLKAAILAAVLFGAFQAIMLFIGGVGGEALKEFVSGIDHWIAFGILAIVGGKMILESLQPAGKRKIDLLDGQLLVFLALATSIDALAVGIGMAFVDHSLLQTALVVGTMTAAISCASVFIGNRYGHLFENKAEIAGGLVLILIGIKILADHLLAG
jgi:putative Mn2+ efflux pump MntP